MSRRNLRIAALLAVSLVMVTLGGTAPSAAAEPNGAGSEGATTKISGTFINPVPGVPTGVDREDPQSGYLEAETSSFMSGDWTGIDLTMVKGTFDLITGDARGTTEATFIGVAADGSQGTLERRGTFQIDGDEQTIRVSERIVGGTLAFEGSGGHVVFEGTFTATGQGTGEYEGFWVRP